MKIGVIADTHLYHRAVPLPGIVMDIFADVDHIIHARDIVGTDVIPSLEEMAPVTAVTGNLDTAEVRKRYGEKAIVTLGGFSIGICHGEGKRGRTADRALGCFAGEDVDCVVFGHSHIPYCRVHDGILLFNPGSPTDKRRNQYFSVGIMDIGDTISPGLVFFNANGVVERL